MKVFVILLLFVGVAFAADSLSRQLGGVDIDTILRNDRLLNGYIRCLLENKGCTGEVRNLKRDLPKALKTGCSDCDPNTKVMVEKVINHLKLKRAEDWVKLLAKYDPKGEYKKRFETTTPTRRA